LASVCFPFAFCLAIVTQKKKGRALYGHQWAKGGQAFQDAFKPLLLSSDLKGIPPTLKGGGGVFYKGWYLKKYFSKNGEALRDGARIIRFRASKRLGVKRD
jgi:hypothetical protein